MLRLFTKWLRNPSRVHARGKPVSTGRDLVLLIDRFLDDNLAYPLEWDDFVSWKSRDAGIEAVRLRVEGMESFFLSPSPTDRKEAAEQLVGIRNDIASSHGMERRSGAQQ
jgi:hypothetical protein